MCGSLVKGKKRGGIEDFLGINFCHKN